MKIIIIRHAEPDYPNNTLTDKGFLEAEALGKHYGPKDFDEVYCSPMNRAMLTAEAVIKGKKEIFVKDWLSEFFFQIELLDGTKQGTWNFSLKYLNNHDYLYKDMRSYLDSSEMRSGQIKEKHDRFIKEFDEILEKNGYVRNGDFYDVKNGNGKTIVFFCHHGVMSVILGHLMNVPYLTFAQFASCYPTGVTTLISEENEKGIANFRLTCYSDTSHLEKEGIEPSKMGFGIEIHD